MFNKPTMEKFPQQPVDDTQQVTPIDGSLYGYLVRLHQDFDTARQMLETDAADRIRFASPNLEDAIESFRMVNHFLEATISNEGSQPFSINYPPTEFESFETSEQKAQHLIKRLNDHLIRLSFNLNYRRLSPLVSLYMGQTIIELHKTLIHLDQWLNEISIFY